MKIVNWNCHGALRNKIELLDKLNGTPLNGGVFGHIGS